MTLQVFTARMGIKDPDWLDVTRGGNDKRFARNFEEHRGIGGAFAPTAGLVYPFIQKRRETGELSEEDWQAYRARYIEEMRSSYRSARPYWDKLLSLDRTVLCCMCSDPGQCHRTILGQEILPKLGAVFVEEIGR